MIKQPSRLCLFLLSMLLAAPALAQIVPPPIPPSGVAPATVGAAPVVAVPAAALPPIEILPPDRVDSLRPSAAPANDLVNIDLPSAPEKPTADLRPTAPKAKAEKKAVAKKGSKPAPADDSVALTRAEDPFSGLVGMPVSDSQLNRFVFPEPVEGIYFPEGTPLTECPKDASPQDPCKPIFLNGRRMMLLQLRAGAQGPIQMLVHLKSGRMLALNLAPGRGPGAVIRVDGAEDGASDTRLAESKLQAGKSAGGLSATEQDVALLARFARGDIPGGYESVIPGKTVRYDLFDAVPMATWSDGARQRVHLLQLRVRGKSPVAVNPGMFRGSNVLAVALDRETIAPRSAAELYLLENVEVE